jgi:TRAP transporter TAXI family solute receptor
MKNRQLDATLQSAGLGVSSIRDLANSIAIAIVPIPAELVRKIDDPAYAPAVIPAGTYQGQSEDVPTVAIGNFLITRDGLADELVYRMTKSTFENLDALVAAHVAAKAIKLENALTGMPIPVHPGAARFYREKGVMR